LVIGCKYVRSHKVTQINPIHLHSLTGTVFFVVPVDESESGIGCIYSGKIPPRIGHINMVGEDGDTREMEVRWVALIGKNRFRLGLMYLDFKFDE
jgi:hypothetical protein